MSKTIKCLACENTLRLDESYPCNRAEYKGKRLCENCFNDDKNDPIGTVIECLKGERNTVKVGEYCYHGDIVSPEAKDLIRSIAWHSSDAWRGYYEGKAPEGWEEVVDTWFCGMDGTNVEGDLEKFHEKWEDKNETPRFPMLVVFLRTSNVFSTGATIYVPKVHKNDFIAWMGGDKE